MQIHVTSKKLIRPLVAATLLLVSAASQAVPFYWTDWTTSSATNGFTAQGTITTPTSSVAVTYNNPTGVGFYQPAGGTDFWQNGHAGRNDDISPYTSDLVDNSPTGTDIVALQYEGNQTLSFSEAIANPVFAYVSLNLNGYAFDRDFELLSVGGVDGNACGYWGCGTSTKQIVDIGGGVLEYRLIGTGEPHGALRFAGTFSQVSWRSMSNEYWNGFTLGVQGTAVEVCETNPDLPGCDVIPVPEPLALALFGLGLTGLGMTRRRKFTGK